MSTAKYPTEWRVASVLDVAEFANGKPFESFVSANGKYKLITLDSIDITGNLKKRHKRVSTDDSSLVKGDLVAVLSDIADGNLLGLCAQIPETNSFVLNQRMTRLRVDSENYPPFVRRQINFRQAHFRSVGRGTSQRHIYKRDFRALDIPLPTHAEQRRIAEALSDVNEMIVVLERMIVKKQAIKQGMMQQLLTGRTRLPGFTEPWTQTVIGSMAQVVGRGTPSTRVGAYWNGDIPWFTPAEIRAQGSGLVSRSERTITSDGLASSSASLLPAGSVLVTSRASIGNCAVADVPVTTNQGFSSMVPKDARSTWFLYYWTQQNSSELKSRSAGSTFLEISARKVAAIVMDSPELDEQHAIGVVLRDADLVLDSLSKQLSKARTIKEGMMQQLLTGRTRLPVGASA